MGVDLSPYLGGRDITEIEAEFDALGYVIFPNVMDEPEVQSYRDALQPYLDQGREGRNDFEGLKTNRVYSLLGKDPIFGEMITHPLALHFVKRDLGASALLSACLAINLLPDETVQPWHFDDSHMNVPLPRPSWGVSAFWALDDTTEENGATEVLPGSHLWDSSEIEGAVSEQNFTDQTLRDPRDDPGARPDAVKAVMPAGSLMLAKGTLIHRGGSNRTQKPRLIVTPQYCVGWARQLENQILAVPRDMAAAYAPRVQELLGYNIHAPFMGYVDGRHPRNQLPS